jgi:hypothetical protein
MSVLLKDEVLGHSVRSERREVPADVTTGRDVVVVGGTAVGVGAGVDVVVVLVVTVVAPGQRRSGRWRIGTRTGTWVLSGHGDAFECCGTRRQQDDGASETA